jgi:hypothetical protein
MKTSSRRHHNKNEGLLTEHRREMEWPFNLRSSHSHASRGSLFAIMALLLPILLLIIYTVSIIHSGWDVLYGYSAVFGPLSGSFLANFALASFILSLCVFGYYTARNIVNHTFVRLSFIVYFGSLLAAKYLLPSLVSNYYQSNFPDSLSHTTLGEWVALTGHISVQPMSLLTWQPGF